ncbi:MAG: tRNA (guanosine(46)-N7)-methyltransferase TrmB [Planctomycetaceae bacterium]|nr:tRNA (guanosine(46)-N7)-methyltransferase TrmB [Planctomycetaceae bacterium]|tara:strand:- start:10 stop:654 length:645 start_codon:yes stop_codon:yes gene_type:complete
MGRRALPKLNPQLAYSEYYGEIDSLPADWDVSSIFESSVPLEVELGSGKGLFITTASGLHPERNFLGIEVRKKYAHYCAAKLSQAGRDNAFMLQGDGLMFFRRFLKQKSVDDVHVYFPDPWWKSKHRKRRVLNQAYIQDVIRVLKDEGRFHFWTDVEEYFLSTLKLLKEFPLLEGPLDVEAKPAEHDMDYRTHYERRTRRYERPVYRSLYILRR